MGKDSRRKQRALRDPVRDALRDLPRADRRRAERDFAKLPTLESVHDALATFGLRELLLQIGEASRDDANDNPPFMLGNLVREAALVSPPRGKPPTARTVRQLARRLFNVMDQGSVARIGHDFHEVTINRLLVDQILPQRDGYGDFVRMLTFMSAAIDWQPLLGTTLPLWCAAVNELERHAQRSSVLSRPAYDQVERGMERWVGVLDSTIKKLAIDLTDLRRAVETELTKYPDADRTRVPTPLLSNPFVGLDDDTFVSPISEFVGLAATPAALHIRAIQHGLADQLGPAFETYVAEYLDAALSPRGWTIDRIDPSPGITKRADVVAISPGQSVTLIVEVKTRLQSTDTRLGHTEKWEAAAREYQSWFNQITGSATELTQHNSLPPGATVYGIAVTLEPHLTSVKDDRTYPNIGLPYREPTAPSAAGPPGLPCRVLPIDQLEIAVDCAAAVTDEILVSQLFNHIRKSSSPSKAAAAAAQDLGLSPAEHPFAVRAQQVLIDEVLQVVPHHVKASILAALANSTPDV